MLRLYFPKIKAQACAGEHHALAVDGGNRELFGQGSNAIGMQGLRCLHSDITTVARGKIGLAEQQIIAVLRKRKQIVAALAGHVAQLQQPSLESPCALLFLHVGMTSRRQCVDRC